MLIQKYEQCYYNLLHSYLWFYYSNLQNMSIFVLPLLCNCIITIEYTCAMKVLQEPQFPCRAHSLCSVRLLAVLRDVLWPLTVFAGKELCAIYQIYLSLPVLLSLLGLDLVS